MTKRNMIITGTLMTVLAGVLGISLALEAVFDMCGWDIIARSPSPSGLATAQVIKGSCGATTSLVTHVDFSYSASPGESHRVFGGEWLDDVNLNWKSENHLEITFRSQAYNDVFLQVTKLGSTTITYIDVSDGGVAPN